MTNKCKCGCVEILALGKCKRCYGREYQKRPHVRAYHIKYVSERQVVIPLSTVLGATRLIFVRKEAVEEMRKFAKVEKERILQDCIDNPGKYLEDGNDKKNQVCEQVDF